MRWLFPARRGAGLWLLIGLLVAGGATSAQPPQDDDDGAPPPSDAPVQFQIDAHTTVRIEHPAQAPLQVTILPGGGKQTLKDVASDEDGNFHVGTEDFNFDGHQDLYTSAVLGQVNESDEVYLFDPVARRFGKLNIPEGAPVNCEGFTNLQVDAKTRSLTSACRGGPMWYVDQYRYDDTGRLYLYRAERMLQSDPVNVVPLDQEIEGNPLAVWTTYAPDGKAIERMVGDALSLPPAGALKPLRARVAIDKLMLHDAPGGPVTRRYLLKGDAVDVLDASDDDAWLKLRFHNPAKGDIDGWVPVGDPPDP